MLSFHNDAAIKEKYLSRVRSHRKMDNILQRIGWQNGKGCAVGCTLENYGHSRYPIELGLPEWLARLEDAIFEGLPNELAMYWPENFLQSIPVGIDVEIVKHKIAIKRLDRLLKIQQENLGKYDSTLDNIISKIISAIEVVKKCHKSEINKNYCDWINASSEAEAAWLAASSWSVMDSERLGMSVVAISAKAAARFTVWSAGMSTVMSMGKISMEWALSQEASWVSSSAKGAAKSADKSAEMASFLESWAQKISWLEADTAAKIAAETAKSAAWKQEADDLLECLRECK